METGFVLDGGERTGNQSCGGAWWPLGGTVCVSCLSLSSSAGSCVGEWMSNMSVEPDALAVVNQLKDLAADPMNRRAIVQDQGCLPGLILFLDHPNPQVVYAALLVSCVHTDPPAENFRMTTCISKLTRSCGTAGCYACWGLWLVDVAGDSLPGRMSSQSGEAEGGVGDDAEPPECRTEVSLIDVTWTRLRL